MHFVHSFLKRISIKSFIEKRISSSQYVVFLGRRKKSSFQKWQREVWKMYHRNGGKSFSLLGTFLVLVFFVIKGFMPASADVAKFYPTSCLGGWTNTENVEGKPDLAENALLADFNNKNSAVLENTVSQIFCSKFVGEVPEKSEIKSLVLKISWAYADKNAVAQKNTPETIQIPAENNTSENIQTILDAPAETNIQIIDTPKTETKTPPSETSAVPVPVETPAESVAPPEPISPVSFLKNIFSTALAQELSSSTVSLPINEETKATTSEGVTPLSQNSSSAQEFLEVRYTLDGIDWKSLGKVSKTDWRGTFEIPVTEWEDLSKIQVSIESLNAFDETPTVYLDGISLEVNYQNLTEEWDPMLYALPHEADGLPREHVDGKGILFSTQSSFRADEEPEFSLTMPTSTPLEITAPVETVDVPSPKSNEMVSIPITPADLATSSNENITTVSTTTDTVLETIQNTAETVIDSITSLFVPEATTTTDTPISFLQQKEKTAHIGVRIARALTNFLFTSSQAAGGSKIVRVSVTDKKGNEIPNAANVAVFGGKPSITINKPENSFHPGEYSLNVDILRGNRVIEVTENFTWGVLAINTNKSLYTVGENVYLQMAALNSAGNTLCNANLKLDITAPNLETLSFLTREGSLNKTTPCIPNNVTDIPDYFLNYMAMEIGTYQMKLTNLDNGYEITDTFSVKDAVPFVVERVGATRINPFKSFYKMTMNVTVNQDFDGTVTEILPKDFEVVKNESSEASPDPFEIHKLPDGTHLIWHNTLKTGQSMTLSYLYQAPKISPEFFLLGTLRFDESKNWVERAFGVFSQDVPVFEEARKWQVASDATIVVILNTTGTNSWTIPLDWSASSTIYVIGAGGAGASGTSATNGGGGSGGAFASTSNVANLFYGTTTLYRVGTGGTPGSANDSDTFFNLISGATTTCDSATSATMSVCAKGGVTATTSGATPGGDKAKNLPANAGASGGNGGATGTSRSGGGGGGAGGIHGTGSNGGATGTSFGGGGGGAADNGATGVGKTATSTSGAPGGTAWNGTLGGLPGSSGVAGGNGSNGSGGGGGFFSNTTTPATTKGGNGSDETTWTATVGGATAGSSGGGGGGGGTTGSTWAASAGGSGSTTLGYGGGGGGGGRGNPVGVGGKGANGVIVILYDAAVVTNTQKDYRWYVNTDAIQPDTALANENTATTLNSVTSAVRLRMNITAGGGAAGTSTQAYTLQYSYGTTSSFTWTDVSATTSSNTSIAWKYKHNTNTADGATTSGSALLSSSEKFESYQSGTTTRSLDKTLLINTEGEFDFALDPVYATGTTYYFRMAKKSPTHVITALDGYTSNTYPAITVNISQSIAFSLSSNTASFGTLSASGARYASSTVAGSNADNADAHTFTASTTASGGYVVTINGTTLTYSGKTIDPIGASAVGSSAGTEQFGMRIILNSGNGTVSAPYNTSNWALDTSAFPDTIATGSNDGVNSVFGVRYIANIASLTDAGSYTANIIFVATGTY